MGTFEGEKARRDDTVKGLADPGPDKKPQPTKTADKDHHPSTLADASDEKKDALDVVQASFGWFNETAQRRLDMLKEDLKKGDKPDWFTRLAESLLEIALGAGAAAAGVRLAEKFTPAAGEVGKEFVKMLFEGGVSVGVTAGRASLAAGSNDNVVDTFINSQKEGLEGAKMENEKQFIEVGRHQIKTVEEAKKLAAACSVVNARGAADEQYEATRDAWVSYLAQAKFGALDRHGIVREGDVPIGPTRTNMSSQEHRARTNESAPGSVPTDAPTIERSALGKAPGVLNVIAMLPEIARDKMNGKPWVEFALLNGVNSDLRKQYTGVPLGEMRIPRQVVAKVDGAPDFTLSLDETGTHNYLDVKERTWLSARAMVASSANASKDDRSRSDEGIRLLLQELVPRSIHGSAV